jgi:hypothetical protein
MTERRVKYHAVNGQWPEGTNAGRDLKPTPQEAVSAAKRLYRFALKKPFRGKIKMTSGRRYTWIRRGVMYVNPDCRGQGWHELVHDLSHLFTHRLFPNAKGHGPQHAFLEKEMIAHVVNSGWLDGKLRSKVREKPPRDVHAERLARLDASTKRWTTKLRRAETALRKIARQRARLARVKAPVTMIGNEA